MSITLLVIVFSGPIPLRFRVDSGLKDRIYITLRAMAFGCAVAGLLFSGVVLTKEGQKRRALARPIVFVGPGTYVEFTWDGGIRAGVDPRGIHPPPTQLPRIPGVLEIYWPAGLSASIVISAFAAAWGLPWSGRNWAILRWPEPRVEMS